jgi:hypothetical protein
MISERHREVIERYSHTRALDRTRHSNPGLGPNEARPPGPWTRQGKTPGPWAVQGWRNPLIERLAVVVKEGFVLKEWEKLRW